MGAMLVAGALFAAYHYVSTRPIVWAPGALVAAEPQQSDVGSSDPIPREGFRLLPRARFSAEVRVLSRSRYRRGEMADVSPLDLAVGWGPMSDSAVIDELDISQSNRFYFRHYDDEPPIPEHQIVTHSANWHLVPADDSVRHELLRVRTGDVINLDGLLIDIENASGQVMRTSLRRNDTGVGACEVILVEKVSFRYH